MTSRRLIFLGVAVASVVTFLVAPAGIQPDASPAYADTSEDAAAGSACRNYGTHGVFSDTANLQECSVGFYACVRDDSGFNASVSDLPPGSMGIIFQPWGADWFTTGGNNGYVQNVCNGTAGSSGLITMIPSDGLTGLADPARPALDVRSLPFDQQLELIQQFCEGECRAEYFVYHAKFLLGDGDPQQLWVSDENDLSPGQFEKVALTYYVTPGPITFNRDLLANPGVIETQEGAAMNASGYMYDMVNTIRTEEHDDAWYEASGEYVSEIVNDGGSELWTRLIILFVPPK